MLVLPQLIRFGYLSSTKEARGPPSNLEEQNDIRSLIYEN